MRISRIVVQNYRGLKSVDVKVDNDLACIIGENNTGKTALLRAVQICLDVSFPSIYRSLVREDIHSSIDISCPNQVLIGVELTGFQGVVNQEALVATWKTAADTARIFYRFRPRLSIREALQNKEIKHGDLTLEDYHWELKGGGNPAIDLTDIDWDNDDVGETVRFSDLQSFLVVNLPALRDVEGELRNYRASPLTRLIEACEIDQTEQNALIAILDDANKKIEQSKTIAEIANSIDTSFKGVSGPAFEMDSTLGLSAANFQAIIRNLKILLSDLALESFEPSRNGLGMNNILYIAILMEYLDRRKKRGNSAGQLVLLEEPEAHLHPQLQSSLLIALRSKGVQILLSSHSTQITSLAPFSSLISLTKRADSSIASSNLASNSNLTPDDVSDLERYLDSTKSNLLFARKVMLVEGAAELYLIPALYEAVHKGNLEREGISIIAIHGVHFDVYASLFSTGNLEKKCAIVADGDLKPSDASDEFDIDIDAPDLAALRGEFVEVFAGATTFEHELVMLETLPMLIETTRQLGAPKITQELEAGLEAMQKGDLDEDDERALIEHLGTLTLKTAKRFGKGRFAQVAARNASLCTKLPVYIQKATDWLKA
ncbi:AAA family ATPase [Thalassospira sp. A3_1]|uniref:ATP-dependent nuclease n=1 Tax=Thalassospira sp. A3_1 TaxID=2821088 RepID=UPI001ADBA223|nr:AAA family ATPase [Thalassospira sp. A3_1]MBO9508300.1 AAA family ATPase [Thalassospira sp. A3_1]